MGMRVRREATGRGAQTAPGRAVGAGGDLDLLFAGLAELRGLAADPDRADDSGQVYDVSIRWGALLAGRFERLRLYHERGQLSSAERARFEALCAQLHQISAVAERLGLARPSVPGGPEPVLDARGEQQHDIDPAAGRPTDPLGELWSPGSRSHPAPVPLDAPERSRAPAVLLFTATAVMALLGWHRHTRSRRGPRRSRAGGAPG